MAAQNRRRVKVYKLNSAGDWDDLGTGFVECKVLEEVGLPVSAFLPCYFLF